MARDRIYESDADRQRAYRQRKAEKEARQRQIGADARLQEELRRIREELHRTREQLRRARTSFPRRKVPAKLIKVLGLLSSDHAGERAEAGRKAWQMLKAAGLTWYDVLDAE